MKFNISFTPASNLIITSDANLPSSGTPVMGDSALWIDYIYLDTDERRQFAQVQHKKSNVLKNKHENCLLVKYTFIQLAVQSYSLLLSNNILSVVYFATLSNCGKFLRVITTTYIIEIIYEDHG